MENRNWNNVTLDEFYKMQEILSKPDNFARISLVELLYKCKVNEEKYFRLVQYFNSLDFLHDNIPTVAVKNEYTINGNKYKSNADLTKITAAQFIDFQNYSNETKPRYEKLLSVFFIPEGHEYNDGYNVKEVQTDLLQLDIATVMSLSFFMKRQFVTFVLLFRHYLTKSMKKMKTKDKTKQKELIQKLESLDLSSLEYFLSY